MGHLVEVLFLGIQKSCGWTGAGVTCTTASRACRGLTSMLLSYFHRPLENRSYRLLEYIGTYGQFNTPEYQ